MYATPVSSLANSQEFIISLDEELTMEQLESREEELLQKKKSAKENLIQSIQSCQTLGKELKNLDASSTAEKINLEIKKESVTQKKSTVTEILQHSEQHHDQRNHLLSARKEAHQEVLHTEIGLRELQVDLCKQQLLLGFDNKPGESNAIVQTVRDIETKVENLNQELATKSALYKEMETAYTNVDSKCNALMEQYQKLFQELKEIESELVELTQAQIKTDQKIDALKARLRQSTDEMTVHYCTISNLDIDLARIASYKERQKIIEDRKKFIERKNQHSFETAESISTYLDALGNSAEIDNILATSTSQEQSDEFLSTSSVESAEHSMVHSSTEVPITSSAVVNFAQTSDSITLPLLDSAISFYHQYFNSSQTVSNSEKSLIRELVLSCVKYYVFKKKLVRNILPQCKETFQQSGYLLKEFILSFYHLMYSKNMPVFDLYDYIEEQARTSNWYEMPPTDLANFRKVLTDTLKNAIQFSTKYRNTASNVLNTGYSPSTSNSTVTVHQSMIFLESTTTTTQNDTSGAENISSRPEMSPLSSQSTPVNLRTMPLSSDEGVQISGNHQSIHPRMRSGLYQSSPHQTPHSRQLTPSVQPWAHQHFINSRIPIAYPTNSQQHSMYQHQYAHSSFQQAGPSGTILNPERANSDTLMRQMPAIASLHASSQRILQQVCGPQLLMGHQVVESPLPHNQSQQSTVIQHHTQLQNRFHRLEAPQQRPQEQNYRCFCGEEAHQTCSGCQVTYYCSRPCQVISAQISSTLSFC